MTKRKDEGLARHSIVQPLMVISLVCLAGCNSAYIKDQDQSTPISFDQFIDQTTGDDVSQKELSANTAYRAKRVNKTIFRWINKQGYYFDFTKRFQQWCDANSGRYTKNKGLDADCTEKGNNNKLLGGYSIQIVTTSQSAGEMTSGHATFYFFREQEMEALRKEQQAREEQAQNQANKRQIEKLDGEIARREKALRDLPTVKKTGQKICRTIEGTNQSAFYVVAGRQVRPQYFLTAFTENTANDKIQLRIASIRAKLSTGFVNTDRLDGDIVLQNNSVIWDDPLLWHPCD